MPAYIFDADETESQRDAEIERIIEEDRAEEAEAASRPQKKARKENTTVLKKDARALVFSSPTMEGIQFSSHGMLIVQETLDFTYWLSHEDLAKIIHKHGGRYVRTPLPSRSTPASSPPSSSPPPPTSSPLTCHPSQVDTVSSKTTAFIIGDTARDVKKFCKGAKRGEPISSWVGTSKHAAVEAQLHVGGTDAYGKVILPMRQLTFAEWMQQYGVENECFSEAHISRFAVDGVGISKVLD